MRGPSNIAFAASGTLLAIVCISAPLSYLWMTHIADRKPLTYRDRQEMLGENRLATELSISNAPIDISTDDLWQTGPYCGANSMYAWLKLKGVDVTHEGVKRRVATGKRGANFLELKRVGRSYGFDTLDVFQVTEDALSYVERPFIALMTSNVLNEDMGHFIVVCKVDAKEISAIDGTSAAYERISRDIFMRTFKGNVLTSNISSPNAPNISYAKMSVGCWILVAVNMLYVGLRLFGVARRG